MNANLRWGLLFTSAFTAALLFKPGVGAACSQKDPSCTPSISEDECPPEIPFCWLAPQQSVQIKPDSRSAQGAMASWSDPALVSTVSNSRVIIPISDLVREAGISRPIEVGFPFETISTADAYAEDVTCGVRAISRALAAIDTAAPTYQALLGFLQDQGMMYEFGTGVEELAFAAQAFGYQGSLPFHGGTMDHLLEELEEARPVVVAIGTAGQGKPGHFVLVSGVSADRERVTFFDPTLGEQTIPWKDFEILWKQQGSSGVVVRKQVPGVDQGVDYLPWVALLASVMALITQTPLAVFRRGLGGRLSFAFDATASTSKSSSQESISGNTSTKAASSTGSGSKERKKSSPNTSAVSIGGAPLDNGEELTIEALDDLKQGLQSADQTAGVAPNNTRNNDHLGRILNSEVRSSQQSDFHLENPTTLSDSGSSLSTSLWDQLPEEDRLAIARTTPESQIVGSSNGGTEDPPLSTEGTPSLIMPDWLAKKSSPPWISKELWTKLPPEDREHALLGYLNSWHGWTEEFSQGARESASEEEWELHVQGGKLLQVTSPWLFMRDGPGVISDKIAEVPGGWAVRWTGKVQEVDGREWYEVIYNRERGWVSSRYVEDYVPPKGFPITEPGHVWVPLPGLYSFSFYVVVDVDAYVPLPSDPREFGQDFPLDIKRTDIIQKVPFGALFSSYGVTMQGSGKIMMDEGNDVYFKLNNPGSIKWMDATGERVICTKDGFVKEKDGRTPAQGLVQVMNPNDAVFSLGSRAADLQSYSSLAGPPEFSGASLFAPDLAEHSFVDNEGNSMSLIEAFPEFTGEFKVEDRGGAFSPGEGRFDLFIEDYDQGLAWYRAAEPERTGTEIYIQHEVGTRVP